MRQQIYLEKRNDLYDLVEIVRQIPYEVFLEDGTGLCINTKSLLGAIYTMEWNKIYCACDQDIYSKIERFVKIG